jgi:protein-S-isoprenylcysteine O-methyltransferase Ste14
MKETRDAAAVRVFPPGVPLLTIAIGIGLNRLWPLKPRIKPSGLARYVGATIVGAAILGLGLYPVILLRRTGQSENPWKPTTQIVDRGPFAFTRNPMYLQMVLGCIGFAMMLRNMWILLLTPVAARMLHLFAILPEEAYLERKFGENYRSYKGKVRRWI